MMPESMRTYIKERIDAGLVNALIPEYMHEGIRRYLIEGILPGDFLLCVLNNDLIGAVSYADSNNVKCIPEYVKLMRTHFPRGSFGSPENVKNYIATMRIDAASRSYPSAQQIPNA